MSKRLFLGSLGVLTLTACLGGERGDEAQDWAFATAPLRVVDVFSSDHLITTPPALENLPEPQSVLDEPFESGGIDGWETKTPGGANGVDVRVEEGSLAHSGKHNLLIKSGAIASELPRLARRIAVRPKMPYRLTALVRTDRLEPADPAGAGASIEVYELGGQRENVTGPANPLVVHRHLQRRRGTSKDWDRLEYTFVTSATTRELEIDLVAALGPATGEVRFDDIVVEEISPLADLLSRAPYLDTTRRIEAHPLVHRVQLNGHDERPTIVAPPSTRWRLPVAPAADTSLRLAVSVLSLGSSTRFCFTVNWFHDVASKGTELARECVGTETSDSPPWREATVDLATYAGKQGTLVFTAVGEGDGVGLWGNPRLVARERKSKDLRPDLILVVIDTLRADHLGIEGYRQRPTSPWLDQLAGRSIRFRRAYATAPWTTPSVGSLMTSRYPAQHRGGARIEREQHLRNPQKAFAQNDGAKAWKSWEVRLLGELFERAATLRFQGLAKDEVTLAERLHAAGYATAGIHANYNLSGLTGMSRGFDRYQLYSSATSEGALGGLSQVRDWLESREGAGESAPYFLLFHLQDPHMPYRLRREQIATFGTQAVDPDSADEPGSSVRWVGDWALEFWDYERLRKDGGGKELSKAVAFYDSAIAHADRALGDFLDELGPNAAIAVVADHGEEFGDHGEFEHGHSLYDEVLRVPLLLHLPEDRRAGEVVDQPVSLIDVAPTFLELAGAEPFPAAEGRSLLATDGTPRLRQGIFAEAVLRGPDRTALIDGPTKYVFTHPMGYLDPYYNPFGAEPRLEEGRHRNLGKEELFDLETDPGEDHNLIATREEEATQLRERVLAYLDETVPGVHLRCRAPGSLKLSLSLDESVSYLKPLTLEENDRVTIAASRHEVVLDLEADRDQEDSLVIRLQNAGGVLYLGSSQSQLAVHVGNGSRATSPGTYPLGDAALAGSPSERPEAEGPWCQLWQITATSTLESRQLDGSTAAGLRALGYL